MLTSPARADAFDPGRTPISLSIRDGLSVDLEVFTIFAEPGETVAIRADRPLVWRTGGASRPASRTLDWTAPETPGLTVVDLIDGAGAAMRLNLIVMHAHDPDSGDAINGYRLGRYPSEPYRGRENYLPPRHFAEVSEDLRNLQISPHFTLGQFLCKQPADGAPYLVLSERLLAKLEVLLEAANDRGWRADTFTVMSGYRTPAYNAAIGNGRYSRHIYGGAADIYIDADGDGIMDDLDGDGQVTPADAAALYELVEELSDTPNFAPYLGGLGDYGSTSAHGPFVHVDERGWRARWGRSAG
ncbi:D-Ala-D-Ala carboxypeptidase family metallohydrolase [Marinicauda salina]|nr:D-Ala-D-Ala carboxypeptidase family metallohydrolase [Marinicauda salina]